MASASKAKRPRRAHSARSCLGPVADLEAHLPPEWWRSLFNALYVKTDGDVVENVENTRREVDFVVSAAAIQPHSQILDLCCGQGRHCIELARRGFRNITGVDRSRVRISSSWGGMSGMVEEMLGSREVHGVFGYVSTLAASIAAAKPALAKRVRYLRYAEHVPDLYGSALFASRRRLAEDPAAVRGMVRAFNGGLVALLRDKEAGIGSLRIGTEMWNYLPNVERIVKIPPSMMLQPWMGSDFTNDDLVKESSILEDYTHKVLATVQLDGGAVVQVEAVPKPDAAVVWGRIVYWVRRVDTMPLKQEFFSERGERVRVLTFTDVRKVGGRVLPTRWDMRPDAKPGNSTTVVLKDAVFDRPLDDEIFSQRNLQKR